MKSKSNGINWLSRRKFAQTTLAGLVVAPWKSALAYDGCLGGKVVKVASSFSHTTIFRPKVRIVASSIETFDLTRMAMNKGKQQKASDRNVGQNAASQTGVPTLNMETNELLGLIFGNTYVHGELHCRIQEVRFNQGDSIKRPANSDSARAFITLYSRDSIEPSYRIASLYDWTKAPLENCSENCNPFCYKTRVTFFKKLPEPSGEADYVYNNLAQDKTVRLVTVNWQDGTDTIRRPFQSDQFRWMELYYS